MMVEEVTLSLIHISIDLIERLAEAPGKRAQAQPLVQQAQLSLSLIHI